MKISAYIPASNGAATLGRVLDGIRAQSRPVEELIVIDSGSTDETARIAEAAGARVVKLGQPGQRLGRGAARARGMAEAAHPLVLSCDQTVLLPPGFVERAERWFDDPRAGAVTGLYSQQEAHGACDRWRARHLFRTASRTSTSDAADFNTAGAMVRADAVAAAGGYDTGLVHGEDADLGRRLLARGHKVVFDPGLVFYQLGSSNAGALLERYWRWNKAQGRMTFLTYLRQVKFSIAVMAREDLAAGDVAAAMISLASPHYQYWRDLRE